ncbi:MAG TPA: Ig-like domain repeat protein [Dehalococcoidia bacterium]
MPSAAQVCYPPLRAPWLTRTIMLLTAALIVGAATSHAPPVRAAALTSHSLALTTALRAVACIDTSTCFAAGAGGAVSHTTNGGGNWDVTGTDTSAMLAGIACPSANVCFAVGAGGVIEGTSDGGVDWGSQSSNTTQDLNAVACTSATSCFAVGAGGTILATSNGASWTPQSSGTAQTLFGIACPNTNSCVAVGAGGTIVTTSNGISWSPQSSGTAAQLNAVSCVHFSTTCYAVGNGSSFTKTSDGTSWTAGTILQSGFGFNGVSCAGPASCIAVGQIGFVFATSDGSTWNSEASHTSQALSGIACPSTVTCIVVGGAGTILATGDGGSNWSGEAAAYAGQISGVACPSTSVCYAVGNVIGGSTDGGATWSILSTARTAGLTAIACPSETSCTAVGVAGHILSTTDGGATWSLLAPFSSALGGVACPTITVCYAAGQGGAIETSASGTWQSLNSTTTESLASIACPAVTTCFAAGASGTIVRTADGTQWASVASGTSRDVVGAACAPDGICYALLSGSNTFLKSVNAGASWSAGSFGSAPAASRLACPAMPVCIAPSWNGASTLIVNTGDQGNTWSQQILGTPAPFLSVACPSLTLCAFGTGDGHLLMASSPATTATLGASANPAASGQALTLTATLSACPSSPGGSVAFFDGLTLLDSAPLSGGQAELTTSNLAAGNHQISAGYGGDANCGAAVSNTLSEDVTPAIPSAISPAAGATGVSTTPTLSWTASAGATSYSVALTDASANQTLPNLTSGTTSIAVPAAEGLVSGHQYLWSIAACSAVGCSPFSTAIAFTTASSAPGAPALATPADQAQNVSTTPTLSWNAPSGAISGTTQYIVYVWDPAAQILKVQQVTTALSYAVPASAGLQPGSFYYWMAQACNPGICGPQAPWRGFTTQPPLGAPQQQAPADGATGVSFTPPLSWGAPTGALAGTTQYLLYVWDPAASRMAYQTTTAALSVTLPQSAALAASHFYYWTVQPCNPTFCGPQSGWRSFTTMAGPPAPGAPALNAPADGAQNVSPTPVLSWSAPSGAVNGTTQYIVDIWDPQASVLRFEQVQPGLSVAVPASAGLVLGHFYYWTVRACKPDACGPQAPWRGFTTTGTLGAPRQLSPDSGATGVGVTPTLAWNAASGASAGTTQYLVYVWDPQASVMKFQQVTTALSVAVPFSSGLVSGHFYYWMVQACDPTVCGPQSGWEGFTS